MKENEAIDIVKPQLKQERFDHTLRVAEMAAALAETYQEPVDDINLAAILHDYAKYFPLEDMEQIIKNSELPQDLLLYHPELWHGPVAAVVMEKDYGITDRNILNAIRYHTTGRSGMNRFETILFLADYIEPGRSFPGVDDVREKAQTDLYGAAWLSLSNTIQFLVGKDATVYPDTFYAYNDLTMRLNGGDGVHG